MKKLGPSLGILALLVIIVGSAFLPSSCLSPAQRAQLAPVIVPLTAAGGMLAERQGVLPPGSTVSIVQGTAIVLSPGSVQERALKLKDLGLQEALKAGVIADGDKLIVDAAGEALVKMLPAESPPEPPAASDAPASLLLPPAK